MVGRQLRGEKERKGKRSYIAIAGGKPATTMGGKISPESYCKGKSAREKNHDRNLNWTKVYTRKDTKKTTTRRKSCPPNLIGTCKEKTSSPEGCVWSAGS